MEIASKEYILEIFSKLGVSKFLDVGCGDATFTVLIAEACQAEEVYGIEISE